MRDKFKNLSAQPLTQARRANASGAATIFVENEPRINNKLRQERHLPGAVQRQNMSLLTELEKSFSGNLYKYTAPTALNLTCCQSAFSDGSFANFAWWPCASTARQQHQMNATEITNFFLKQCQRHGRPGRCFEGWTADKVFNYVLVNLVHRNVFVARDRFGFVGLAAIAWLDDAARIKDLDARGLPLFDWKGFPKQQSRACQQAVGTNAEPSSENRSLTVAAPLDSILIADVAGNRKWMPEILKQFIAVAAPLAILQKRLFTYRRNKLVELSWPTVLRFSLVSVAAPRERALTEDDCHSPGQTKESHSLLTVADCGLGTVDSGLATVARFCGIKNRDLPVKRTSRKESVPQTDKLEGGIQLAKSSIVLST